MKKILSVIALVMLFCICLTSCESSKKPDTDTNINTKPYIATKKIQQNQDVTAKPKTTQQNTTPKQVQLTPDNINQYLIIGVEYGEKTEHVLKDSFTQKSRYVSSININTEPSVPGFFYNVSVTFKIRVPNDWYLDIDDSAYPESVANGYIGDSEGDRYLTATVRLTANGSKAESHCISTSYGHYGEILYNSKIKVQIISVSGTFVPAT